jgi:hypothetical protein
VADAIMEVRRERMEEPEAKADGGDALAAHNREQSEFVRCGDGIEYEGLLYMPVREGRADSNRLTGRDQ